ncbi:iron complex outermembrane receptor protein [Nitrosospira sp. Nsp5]|uniref:Iron complex outermembrane recepter protein n=1 Tax=Nitrosospira multiformis TaxID=1231 RepID=A0ABY0THA7_9PROT|nr:iron complex outermembrane receptor protein [Nitrosospira sp. Nsp5]SDQ83321.1 iron complex outermembrane recepter protein [Nitrosospira multiformis]
MRWIRHVTVIKQKPVLLTLASLFCASSVWAAGEAEPPAKDAAKSVSPAEKKPTAAAPSPEALRDTDVAPAPTEKKTPTSESAIKLPEMTIGGKVTPIAKQTDKERYRLPQTTESITREKMDATVNMMQTEDAIKYLPSVQVRNRYIGDTNAPVGTRTSGTSASARSLIYADGILLSSLLGNNNTNTGSPRWNTVSPGEIDRIDIMYGPFSAAYPGNSMGGVINITTRMPEKFEAGVDVQQSFQTFNLYGTKDTYHNQRYSGYIGHKYKDLSMRFDYSHLDAHSQPIIFTTPLQSAGAPLSGGETPVTGAIAGQNPTLAPNYVLGAGNINHTVQDNFKWKLAYDFTPTIRFAYTFGMWQNNASASAQSYLRDAAGNVIDSGAVNINGRRFNLNTVSSGLPAFAANRTNQTTWSHGLNLRSNTGGKFDWELVGSVIDLSTDNVRQPTVNPILAAANGPGRITSLAGSGWHTFDAKGIWRPRVDFLGLGYHEISFGFHHDLYTLKNPVFNTSNWQTGGPATTFSNSTGKTRTEGYWVQDAWDFLPHWNFTVGGRFENWHAYDGVNTTAAGTVNQTDKSAFNFSPKGKLSWSPIEQLRFGAAIGQAYRYPTASELFQTTTVAGIAFNANPNLRSEDALSSELSAEYFPEKGRVRLSLFQERVKNAIFTQVGTVNGIQTSFISNVGEVDTYGVEFSGEKTDAWIRGLDILGNFTWADSRINENHAADAAAALLGPTAANPNAAVPSTGKRQPRVPQWRSNVVVSYRATDKFTITTMLRYSSGQFGQLNNTDTNGFSYTGLTSYTVVDLRANYRLSKQVMISGGIDNVNNEKYWVFHPMPQRTYFTQIRFNY